MSKRKAAVIPGFKGFVHGRHTDVAAGTLTNGDALLLTMAGWDAYASHGAKGLKEHLARWRGVEDVTSFDSYFTESSGYLHRAERGMYFLTEEGRDRVEDLVSQLRERIEQSEQHVAREAKLKEQWDSGHFWDEEEAQLKPRGPAPTASCGTVVLALYRHRCATDRPHCSNSQ